MKGIDKKMLQSSLLCGPKGAVIFVIGAANFVNGLLVRQVHKKTGEEKMREGLYAMYNNFIPFLEVIVVMGFAMPLLRRFYALFTSDSSAMIFAVLSCLPMMLAICLTLRVLEKRFDCCADFDHGKSLNGELNSIRFKIPSNDTKKNSLKGFLPKFLAERQAVANFFSYDWLEEKIVGKSEEQGGNRLGTGDEDDAVRKSNAKYLDILNRIITAPLFAILTIIQLIEVIPRLLIDTYKYIQAGDGRNIDEFKNTENFIKQNILFSLSRCMPIAYFKSVENTILAGCFCGAGNNATPTASTSSAASDGGSCCSKVPDSNIHDTQASSTNRSRSSSSTSSENGFKRVG